jgi:CRP/FNR family transcriptional regulator, cyclic AMP receptor protein
VDAAARGCPISFLTSASSASSDCFLSFFFGIATHDGLASEGKQPNFAQFRYFQWLVKKWRCSFLDSFAILLVLACGTIKVCPSLLDKDYMATNTVSKKVPPSGMNLKKKSAFDAHVFLDSVGASRRVAEFQGKQAIFSQGDPADSVMYVQEGGVKFTVVNESGKEAVVAIFGPGDFFGEGCMAGQTIRMATATAIAPTTILVIEKDEMIRVLSAEHELSDRFIAHMLARNIRVEADLIDQLFNSTEKRLARTLLLLARYGKDGQPEPVLRKISQETLADMIGTTRSRVNLFMNKFRKLGFIEYNGEIKINKSLLSVVLHE